MTKKGQKTSPITPGSEVRALVNTNEMSDSMKLTLNSDIEMQVEVKDGVRSLILIINGRPAIYWTHVYKKLGISRKHAGDVIGKLKAGKHYISFTNSEIKRIYPNVTKMVTLVGASNCVFLYDEGWVRAIQEISTGSMSNKDLAARIDLQKDEISEVFTKYKRGDLISDESDFDIGAFDTSKKGMSSLNGVRIRLQGMLAKQRHPATPNTVRRKIEMFRRDWRVMKGNDSLEKNWRPKESDEGKKKLTGWYAFGIYSFTRGHLEPEEQSRDLKEFYAACPDLLPEHLPELIETTTQMKLTAGENS